MKALNKKLLLSIGLILLAGLLAMPAFAANVRFACAADAERPTGSIATVPTKDAREAKADYQIGEIVIEDSATTGQIGFAIQVTGDPVTTYRCNSVGCARETRYPCKRVDPASVPEDLRWPGRRR